MQGAYITTSRQIIRCPWVNLDNPLYVAYHDSEWGQPVHDDIRHFEFLSLEGAQAGLSWETVLNKRENYRKLFADFNPHKVSRFSETKINKILNNPGIIRNRLKIYSVISNAKAFIKIQQEFSSFDKYIWNYVNNRPIINRFESSTDYPTKTKLSDTISKDLKKRGFKFVGSTIIYAYMQAAGLVNDHSIDCCKSWNVYMVRCSDNSLYTGITNNISRRIKEHNSRSAISAKYTRAKAPCNLVYQEFSADKSAAAKREAQIKKLAKSKKEKLVKEYAIVNQNQHS